MGTASYIIFLLLLGLTIFNLFAMISAKKRKSRAAYDYNRVMKPLDDKLLRAMKERKIEFTAVQRFVNDLGEGIVVVRDLKKKNDAEPPSGPPRHLRRQPALDGV